MLKFDIQIDILSEIFTQSRPGQFIIIVEKGFLCKNKAPRGKYEQSTTWRENIHLARLFEFLYSFNYYIIYYYDLRGKRNTTTPYPLLLIQD